MNLSIRIFFLLLLLNTNSMLAQEEAENPEESSYEYSPGNPESVFFELETIYPLALGNNVYSEAYTYDLGYGIDFNLFLKKQFTLGARISSFRGYVQDVEKTGNYSKTGFMLFGIHAGYYQVVNKEWSLHHKIGVGALNYVNHAPEDTFNDTGTQLSVSTDVAYRFSSDFALFAKLSFQYHLMNIQTTDALDSYFNKAPFLQFGIGLRWHLQNPGG